MMIALIGFGEAATAIANRTSFPRLRRHSPRDRNIQRMIIDLDAQFKVSSL